MAHLCGKSSSMFNLMAHFLQIQAIFVHAFLDAFSYPDSIELS
jgi:hypothetical protein